MSVLTNFTSADVSLWFTHSQMYCYLAKNVYKRVESIQPKRFFFLHINDFWFRFVIFFDMFPNLWLDILVLGQMRATKDSKIKYNRCNIGKSEPLSGCFIVLLLLRCTFLTEYQYVQIVTCRKIKTPESKVGSMRKGLDIDRSKNVCAEVIA